MKEIKKWSLFSLKLIGITAGIALIAILIFSFGLPNYKHQNSSAILSIHKTEDGYKFWKNGAPQTINGVAGEGHLHELKETGGNTIRLYHYYLSDSLLSLADSLQLNVIVDLDLPRESLPFDYGDPQKVDSLVNQLKKSVTDMMHHPSIIVWNIGNEICAPSWRMAAPWRTVGRIAQELKQLDPSRLTSTSVPLHPTSLIQARMYANNLDFLSINSFKLTLGLTDYWDYCIPCWDGPYLYSELGPMGTWQVEANAWNVHQELGDINKSEYLAYMYEHFLPAEKNCLGSCAFFWGFKQERTHTWYSLFSEQGEATPSVNELERVWKGSYPANLAPRVEFIEIFDGYPEPNIALKAGTKHEAIVHVSDPENDSLQISWEIYHEGNYRHKFNGEGENRPKALPDLIISSADSTIQFKVPETPGDYRLFVYARDGHNNFSSFNLPFFVVLDSY